ncbi:hypothetical protein J6590_000074 [Homalodisca vitripennis]|nr:hypothetical protein J6590_000074 [Homalodisca vitripennis]
MRNPGRSWRSCRKKYACGVRPDVQEIVGVFQEIERELRRSTDTEERQYDGMVVSIDKDQTIVVRIKDLMNGFSHLIE